MLNELHTTLDGRVRLSRRSEQGALGPERQHALCAGKQTERRLERIYHKTTHPKVQEWDRAQLRTGASQER